MKKGLLFILLGLVLAACGSATENGGTETGSSNPGIDTSTLSTRLAAVGSSLVLNVSPDSGSADLSALLRQTTYADTSNWDTYIDADHINALADIFAEDTPERNVVTQVRVQLDQFASTVGDIFEADPTIACTTGSALSDRDTLEVPFFGEVSNGTSSNRFYDCISESSETGNIYIYGQDSSGNVRFVLISDMTTENTELPETRGDTSQVHMVVQSVYSEQTADDGLVSVYLDIQYAQASVYNGADGEFGNDDDVIFKSRDRITGLSVLDADGNPTLGDGEFAVTKYDESPNPSSTPVVSTTTAVGRGSYGAGDYSLLNIDTTELEGLTAGVFCIQMPSDGTTVPTAADSTNCTSLETALAWGSTTFPFDLSPALSANFDDESFYAGDDVDLIANDGSNFTVPTY